MERNLWRQSYGTFARMTCPTCSKGTLRMDRTSFQREVPEHVRIRLSSEDTGADYTAGRFKGFLRCENKFCGEIVAITGNFTTEYHHDYDHEAEEPIVRSRRATALTV